jgi:hypothetical protein
METPDEQPGYAERDGEPTSEPTGGGVDAPTPAGTGPDDGEPGDGVDDPSAVEDES